MSESDRFDEVERHARSARAALDDAVADTAIPDVPTQRRPRPLRQPMLVAAAAIVIVALAAAVLLVDDGDERGTVAGEPEPPEEGDEAGADATHLHLPDPAAFGYEVTGATDGPDLPDGSNDFEVIVQGPADAEDPWRSAFYTMTHPLPAEAPISGQVVDVGGPDAVFTATGGVPSVMWRDGDRSHSIVSARLDRSQLATLARSAVAEGYDGSGALPGQRVLHEGSSTHVYPVWATPSPLDRALIGYRHPDAGDFFVASGPGSEEQWRAPTVRAPVVERTTVAGHEALFSDYRPAPEMSQSPMTEVSWRTDDGTIVRIAGPGDIRPLVGRIAGDLRPIEEDQLENLVEMRDRTQEPLIEVPDVGEDDPLADPSDDPQLASDAETIDGTEYRVTVVGQPGEALVLQTSVVMADSRSHGNEPPRETTVAQMEDMALVTRTETMPTDDGEPRFSEQLIAGVVPPDLARLEIRDRSTGEVLDPFVLRTSPIEGTDNEVLLAIIEHDAGDRRLEVVARTAAGGGGGETRYWI